MLILMLILGGWADADAVDDADADAYDKAEADADPYADADNDAWADELLSWCWVDEQISSWPDEVMMILMLMLTLMLMHLQQQVGWWNWLHQHQHQHQHRQQHQHQHQYSISCRGISIFSSEHLIISNSITNIISIFSFAHMPICSSAVSSASASTSDIRHLNRFWSAWHVRRLYEKVDVGWLQVLLRS